MMLDVLARHAINFAHGASAALLTLAVFYAMGRLALPRSMQMHVRWPDCVTVGVALGVTLCWIAVTSRHIPIIYVALVILAVVSLLLLSRLRWAKNVLTARLRHPATKQWIAEFCLFYLLAYMVIGPSAEDGLLPLAPEGNIELVTYSRYAKQVLELGSSTVELAPFEFVRSPAGIFLLALQSLPFGRDPLDAAIPTIVMLAALFGMIAAAAVRAAFPISRRAAFAIGAVGICSPGFRWSLATYSLSELTAATVILAAVGALVRNATRKQPAASFLLVAACGALLWFAVPPQAWRPASIASGIGELFAIFSAAALVGLPQPVPGGARASVSSAVGVGLLLAAVPLFWGAVLHFVRRSGLMERIASSEIDRELARSLTSYAIAAVVIGNVAIHAVHGPETARRPGTWRQLADASGTQFQGITLKVAEEPAGLSTALAMYYLGDRKAEVLGPDVSPESLSFDDVSRQRPMFIQNLDCNAVGHRDTASVRGVGCLLLAPPSMALDESYQFNRPYLFLDYDENTTRDPGGRWNTRPTLNLAVTADPQRARLDREYFVNILVHPFLPEGVKPQRLVLRWGTERIGETLVADRKWFSLPVRAGDWNGNRLWKLPIIIDFPDGRTILFQEISLTQSPRGEVVARSGQSG